MSTPRTERARLADFDPGELLRMLEAHHVRSIVIGAIAAIAPMAPVLTTDLDVAPGRSHENLERLARALHDLDARLRRIDNPHGLTFPIDAGRRETADSWTLTTRAGALDLVFSPRARPDPPTSGAPHAASRSPASASSSQRSPT